MVMLILDIVISTFAFDGDYDHYGPPSYGQGPYDGGNNEYEAFGPLHDDDVHYRDYGGDEYDAFGPLHEVQNHLFPFLLLVLRGHVVFPLRLCTVSIMATLSEQVEASSCPCVKWKYL